MATESYPAMVEDWEEGGWAGLGHPPFFPL